jgi:hypothetical protein
MYTLMEKRELQDLLKCKLGLGIGEVFIIMSEWNFKTKKSDTSVHPSQSQGKWKLHSLADYISQNDDANFFVNIKEFKNE